MRIIDRSRGQWIDTVELVNFLGYLGVKRWDAAERADVVPSEEVNDGKKRGSPFAWHLLLQFNGLGLERFVNPPGVLERFAMRTEDMQARPVTP
jgi:hypothetical protein